MFRPSSITMQSQLTPAHLFGRYIMTRDWLIKQLTVQEIEALHSVRDERLGPDPVPFGFINDRWKALLAEMQPGDELWEFRSPPESWMRLSGRAGIAVVRNGEVVDSLTTAMN